ncbi:MAG: GTP-binding protein, partial [Candidatus Aminicenantes bacterium]|nr:GTP-binding protein [Candidatus Aminicenantes bacterium]
LKHIESFGGDSPVLVVINKIDENPGFEVNRKFLQEKYKNIKGFYRVSCKSKKGINTFESALKEELSRIEMLKTTWAASWFNVKTSLENMEEHFISYKEYLDICTNENINTKSSQDTLVDFLNDLGIAIHFKELELEDTHVLEPKWVTEAVYKIINSEKLAKCNGVLKVGLLDEILKQKDKDDYYYPPDKYRYIIELMKKFELCYKLDANQVLIPDLLEVEERTFDFNYDSSLKFIIEYDFLPKSVMPRFIVRMNKDIKKGLQWRTGVVLEDKAFHSTAVVKSDERDRKIYIFVNGEQKRDYFSTIRKTLRDINGSFEKLETKELVPLPD